MQLAAVALTAAFIWWPLFMAAYPFHSVPSAQSSDGTQHPTYGQPHPDGFWSIKIGDVLTLVILTVQAGIFVAQAVIGHKQRVLMRGQLKTAKVAADAAKIAANAALASLDRPWIIIEGLKNTRINWMSGQGDLTAELRIANYGKAPAILASVRAVLFLGYENGATCPFGAEGISPTILKFPSEVELKFFLLRLAKWPLVDVSGDSEAISALVERPPSGPGTFVSPIWGWKNFDSPDALPSGFSTKTFRWQESDLASPNDGKVPEDGWADVYLVGQIVYFGPTIETEVINFSYKANRFGGFHLYGGAPYNERKKGPEMAGNLGF